LAKGVTEKGMKLVGCKTRYMCILNLVCSGSHYLITTESELLIFLMLKFTWLYCDFYLQWPGFLWFCCCILSRKV